MTAHVRYAYMDAVTRLVETSFSTQLGMWCSAHGVEYIGHVIEDNNQHARTGSALGHFFRGLAGQHMAGVDVVTRQVLPQGEVQPLTWMGFLGAYDSEFYHFVLAKLGSSHAAIDPLKQGRSMCEIFGNYGWSEGVRLEKYLADHFLVRGINHYVPHAFSPKKFPDPDCPPHFYADGHDPQYRHFGHLMAYMNRVCELISGGRRVTTAAILYHGEAEWTGKYMLMQKPARLLAEHQIDYEFIPADIFTETDHYRTDLSAGLEVNGKRYKALVVPTAEYISADFARAAGSLQRLGFPIFFLESLPRGIYNGDKALLAEIKDCRVVPLSGLVSALDTAGVPEIAIAPASDRLRVLHYVNGSDIFYLVNEAASPYRGQVSLPVSGSVYAYNAWENRLETVSAAPSKNGTALSIHLEPYKSLIVVCDDVEPQALGEPLSAGGQEIALPSTWQRSLCTSLAYPRFTQAKSVTLPDNLAKEKPKFSGFARYENEFTLGSIPARAVLEISDAWEGVWKCLSTGSARGSQDCAGGVSVGDITLPAPGLAGGSGPCQIEVGPHWKGGGAGLPWKAEHAGVECKRARSKPHHRDYWIGKIAGSMVKAERNEIDQLSKPRFWEYQKQNTTHWQAVNLPHDAMLSEKRAAECANGSNTGFFPGGSYVYRKQFDVPAAWAGQAIAFEFEGVYRHASVSM